MAAVPEWRVRGVRMFCCVLSVCVWLVGRCVYMLRLVAACGARFPGRTLLGLRCGSTTPLEALLDLRVKPRIERDFRRHLVLLTAGCVPAAVLAA